MFTHLSRLHNFIWQVLASRWKMWVDNKLTVTQESLALAFPFPSEDEEDQCWVRFFKRQTLYLCKPSIYCIRDRV